MFYVNGTVWASYNDISSVFLPNAWAELSRDKNGKSLIISANRRDNGTWLIFTVNNPKANENLKIHDGECNLIKNDSCTYIIGDNSNICITKLDTIHEIVSGTFSFDAKCKDSNSTIHVEKGRFDIYYSIY